MRLIWVALCLAAIVLTVDGRGGGRSRSRGRSRSGFGGWGTSSSTGKSSGHVRHRSSGTSWKPSSKGTQRHLSNSVVISSVRVPYVRQKANQKIEQSQVTNQQRSAGGVKPNIPSAGNNQHYPVQQGGSAYQQQYYPPPPPPPPGYSPYGAPYYKDKSGIRGSEVIAGLALWELMRSRNHHHHGYGIQEVHHHHYQDGSGGYDSPTYYQPTYHDAMRERYTTRTTPSRQTGPGAYNILEMTHYITADDKGVISSSEGNMTCISVYNAKSARAWHQMQVNNFKKQYPDSIYPLYRTENDTQSENFTVVAGRIIHKEPVTITCCGTNKGPLDLNLLTNGKHPNVNCVNHVGHIPIRKLTFVRTQAEIQLHDSNATTPVPLAPFPDNSSSNSSKSIPLASLPTILTNS